MDFNLRFLARDPARLHVRTPLWQINVNFFKSLGSILTLIQMNAICDLRIKPL